MERGLDWVVVIAADRKREIWTDLLPVDVPVVWLKAKRIAFFSNSLHAIFRLNAYLDAKAHHSGNIDLTFLTSISFTVLWAKNTNTNLQI